MQGKDRLVRRHAAVNPREETAGSLLGNGRNAGPEAMADPDASWDQVSEASDESFPCSDPPSWSAGHVGGKARH